jgi:hypothetical protein
MSRAYNEANHFVNILNNRKMSNSSLNAFEELEKLVFIRNLSLETLRLTAHSIGAIRKVMPKEGWNLVCCSNDSDVIGTYTIPCGSYVGVSHIVPNISSAM